MADEQGSLTVEWAWQLSQKERNRLALSELSNSLEVQVADEVSLNQLASAWYWLWKTTGDYSNYINQTLSRVNYYLSPEKIQEIANDLSQRTINARSLLLRDVRDVNIDREIAKKKAAEIVKLSLAKLKTDLDLDAKIDAKTDSWYKIKKWSVELPIMVDNKSASLIKMSIPELAVAWYSVAAAIWALANALWWNWELAFTMWVLAWWCWEVTSRTLFWKDIPMPDNEVARNVLNDASLVLWYFQLFFAPDEKWLTANEDKNRYRMANSVFIKNCFNWDQWSKQNKDGSVIDLIKSQWLTWVPLKNELIRLWFINKWYDSEFEKMNWDQLRQVLLILFWQNEWKNLRDMKDFNDIYKYVEAQGIPDVWWILQGILRGNFKTETIKIQPNEAEEQIAEEQTN